MGAGSGGWYLSPELHQQNMRSLIDEKIQGSTTQEKLQAEMGELRATVASMSRAVDIGVL